MFGEKIKLHPEKPIDVPHEHPYAYDSLMFRSSVEQLSQIVQSLETPFTIGIYGRWGSGKTSFMRLLEAQIKKDGCKTFWFNAWQYENETSLLIPFLSKLCSEVGPEKPVVKEIKKLAFAVVGTAATAISDVFLKSITLGMVDTEDVEKQLEKAEKKLTTRYDSWVDEVENLQNEFKKLVSEFKGDSPSVAIFIDDLDRCLPDNSIRLIENIKHFLSVEKCIFVLGVDNAVLSAAIQQKYAANPAFANEYLEKIINLPVHIPEKMDIAKDQYIESVIRSMADERWFKQIRSEVKQFIAIMADLFELTNPRKLRLLILRYLFFLSLRDRKKYVLEIVIKLIVYKEFFPDAYALKKKNGRVSYVPDVVSGRSGKEHTYEQIEKVSGRGFAEIDKNFRSLVGFGEETRNLLVLFGRDDDAVDRMLNKDDKTAVAALSIEQLDAIQKIPEYKKYKRQHVEYFDVVDFVFSLG